MLQPVDYCEYQPPAELAHLIKVAWTLSVDIDGDETSHVATPDGCVELIHRLSGSSYWQGAQPNRFVAGLITGPAELRLGPGSRFVALRLRPWAWNRLAPRCPAPSFINRWRDLQEASLASPLSSGVDGLFALISPDLLSESEIEFAEAIEASSSLAELAAKTGRPRRWIQRWFEREVGLPPRTYLRLLRFNDTFSGLQDAEGSLADHAAAHGFADQAHMAREFRRMSGRPAVKVRSIARGPFMRGDA